MCRVGAAHDQGRCGGLYVSYHRYNLSYILISKLFAPICSQFSLYICYLGEFIENKTHRFQHFSTNYDIIERVYILKILWCIKSQTFHTSNCDLLEMQLFLVLYLYSNLKLLFYECIRWSQGSYQRQGGASSRKLYFHETKCTDLQKVCISCLWRPLGNS